MGMFNDKINVRGGVEVARNNSAGLHFYSPSPSSLFSACSLKVTACWLEPTNP